MSVIDTGWSPIAAAFVQGRGEPVRPEGALTWKEQQNPAAENGNIMPASHEADTAIFAAPAVLATHEGEAFIAPSVSLPALGEESKSPGKQQVIDEFLDYMSKSSAERMREQILLAMGLTEEDLENMSPEQRRAVEDTVAQIIRDRMEEGARQQQAQQSGYSEGQQPAPTSAGGGILAKVTAPSEENIQQLATEAAGKIQALRIQYGVPENVEFSVSFDRESGQMQIAVDEGRRASIEKLLAENPIITQQLRTSHAMASLQATLQEREPFIAAYQQAGNVEQAQQAVVAYDHWFGSNPQPQANISLHYSGGDMQVMRDAQPFTSTAST